MDRWRGEYYANPDLQGTPTLVRDDLAVSFNWGEGAPAPNLPADAFSARWTRSLYFDAGDYRFALTVDDGARLWIDGQLLLDGWSVGSVRTYQRDVTLSAGYHSLEVDYFEQIGAAAISLGWTPAPTYQNWKGEYFANADVSGAPLLTRDDLTVDFNWGAGAPAGSLPADGFSARWTRTVWLEEGAYRFVSNQDDGLRAWADDALVIDHWRDGSLSEDVGYRYLESGWHTLRVEYYDRAGVAVAKFQWQRLLEFTEWKGEYFANPNLTGKPAAARGDRFINFDWSDVAPILGLPATHYSVRWTQTLSLAGGMTRFTFGADDGMRVWLDEQLLADHWQDGLYREWTAERNVSAGPHTLRVEYYQRTGKARIMLRWETVAPPATATPSVTQTPRPTMTASRTATATATRTGTPGIPPTSTRTATGTRATASATPSRTGTRPATTPSATTTRGAMTVVLTPWPTLTPEPAGRRLVLEPGAALPGEKVRIRGEGAAAGAGLRVGLSEYGQDPAGAKWLTEAQADDRGVFSAELELPLAALKLDDGFVVVAYDPLRQTRWASWLPRGASVPFSSLDAGLQTSLLTPAPFARVFTTRAEWERYHQPARRTIGGLLNLLERRLRRIEPSSLDPTPTPEIDWTRYVVAEVSLGKAASGQAVKIVTTARAGEGLQVVFRVAPAADNLDREPGEGGIPSAAILIERSALGKEALPVVFITTLGQRLPATVVEP